LLGSGPDRSNIDRLTGVEEGSLIGPRARLDTEKGALVQT
jgi:hypothetical protein